MSQKLSYCGEIVRAQDPDRFLLSMFAPPARRAGLWALFAFNHEIARTREAVTETQLGLIRLQWWREALADVYEGRGAPKGHQVLEALEEAIRAHTLPQTEFETLIYAREFDLEGVQPGNLEGLLNYADYTATPLFSLAVRIAGGAPESEPVQPVAVNYALAGILRAVPFHARQGRCILPEDLTRRAGIRLDRLYALKGQEGMSEVVKEVAGQIVPGIRPESRILRAAQALAMIYEGQIRRLGHDVLDPRLQRPPAFKTLRLLFK